jgi:hypothetical protein
VTAFNFGYNFSQIGTNNPNLTCYRDMNYDFILSNLSNHPIALRLNNGDSLTEIEGAYNNDQANGKTSGIIMFTPNINTPSEIVYQCVNHPSMIGTISILNQ